VVQIGTGDDRIVRDSFPWVTEAGWQPCFAVVRDGAAVSVCFSARTGARAAAAGVETRPEFRGRGYAAAVTAAWGAAIQAKGLIPFYSTTWKNQASQGVARRLGLTMFGADWQWT
jgi:predicted GNAT family acetyltransferase